MSRRCIAVSDPVKKVEGSLIPGMKGGYVLYKVGRFFRLLVALVPQRWAVFFQVNHEQAPALNNAKEDIFCCVQVDTREAERGNTSVRRRFRDFVVRALLCKRHA